LVRALKTKAPKKDKKSKSMVGDDESGQNDNEQQVEDGEKGDQQVPEGNAA